jgi:glycosyltransferase involved in cell wall biosynthesis
MSVALVHDWLNQLGGAEDVLVALHNLYPRAPIYTSIYDRRGMPREWLGWDIRSSWMDRLPNVHRMHQPYMPLYALTFARTRIPAAYDLVVSNKSAFCLGVKTAPGTRHICYCLTPTRFIFDFDAYAARERIPGATRIVLRALNCALRRWERDAAQRVTEFIAISREVRERIKRCYGRDATIIYPPVQVSQFAVSRQDDGYFLIVSRLLPYKRIDLAIEACNQLGLPLVIAGDGRDRDRLARLAGPTVTLLGRVDNDRRLQLLSGCRAFIFPGLEDFGIAPIEAMACGKPVIAYAGGGSLDTVIDGRTGLLFCEPTAGSLAQAIQRFAGLAFHPDRIRAHAERFGVERFKRELLKIVAR